MSEAGSHRRVDRLAVITHIDELDYIKNLLYALWMAIQTLPPDDEVPLATLAGLIEDRLEEALNRLRKSLTKDT